jgi:opacity protein-like surface antigen
VIALVILGFGLKIGLVPLHGWMPLSYASGPLFATAALSGATSKAGIIGLITFLPFGMALGRVAHLAALANRTHHGFRRAGADAFSPGFCDSLPQSATAADGCRGEDGGIEVGLRAGYDWSLGGFLVGGLVEWSHQDLSDSVTGFSSAPAAYSFTREVDNIWAVRARVGAAIGPVLAYATGGYAYGDVARRFTTTNDVNSFADNDANDDAAHGYQAGGGVETMVSDSFSMGIEYLYTAFDDEDFIVRAGPGDADPTNPFLLVDPTGTDIRRSADDLELHTVRITGSYRFQL